jgi:hypothetical protein
MPVGRNMCCRRRPSETENSDCSSPPSHENLSMERLPRPGWKKMLAGSLYDGIVRHSTKVGTGSRLPEMFGNDRKGTRPGGQVTESSTS